MIRLGIDTGGTYTDAVVIDTDSLEVLAKAKALTTKEDLARGIIAAMDGIPHEILVLADHVALSTTLATNACVEGKGGRAKLIIVGTTDEILRRVDAERVFGIPYEDVITTEFVGSFDGSEVTVPDWEALYESNPSFFENAESFGIASLYALNNGAIVEHSCADFLKKRFGKLVVEATTVAVEPNVIGRGATALLNARLVPVIEDFLDAIDDALAERGLSAPVSVVRSDGTLMSAELARTRPVETILSGPAASVTGAQVLSNAPESLIVDIGGTTSDMSVVHEGRPNTKNSRLELGTRKVTPLCIAASRWPSIKQALKWYYQSAPVDFYSRYEFLYLMRNPRDLSRFREPDQRLIEILREGPLLLYSDRAAITGLRLQQLEDEGVVMRCGFTPTDAMHLKGDFDVFDVEASQLGAQCILKSYRGKQASEDEGEIAKLADEVYELAEFRLFEQALGVFSQDAFWPKGSTELDSQMHELAKRAWQRRHDDRSHTFDVRFSGDAHFIGIGAPTHVFLEEAASALHVPCVIPEHAEVANAIGAAASRVVVETTVRVNPIRESSGVVSYYQVCGSEETLPFEEVDQALEAARELARKQSFAEARRRGAVGELDCTIKENRVDYLAMGTMTVVREWTVSALVG